MARTTTPGMRTPRLWSSIERAADRRSQEPNRIGRCLGLAICRRRTQGSVVSDAYFEGALVEGAAVAGVDVPSVGVVAAFLVLTCPTWPRISPPGSAAV